MRIEILFFSLIATLVSAHDDIYKNGDVVNLNEEGDYRLIEGDILVPKESHLRGSINLDFNLWSYDDSYDKYIVPYFIDGPIYHGNKLETIQFAMAFYEKHTNLKFINKTDQQEYLNITVDKSCSFGFGSNLYTLSLDTTCADWVTVFHEMGHSLGLEHEHQRADRDEYVKIATTYYQYNAYNPSNFVTNQITPYDIASIMHYDSNIWYYTIQSLKFINPERAKIFKKVSIPSTCDIREINIMYPGEVKPGPCIPHQPENIYRPTQSCLRDKSKEDCDKSCNTDFKAGSEKGECEHPTLEELKTMKPLPQYAYTGERALPFM